jgi:hypothetical protein
MAVVCAGANGAGARKNGVARETRGRKGGGMGGGCSAWLRMVNGAGLGTWATRLACFAVAMGGGLRPVVAREGAWGV